MCGVLGQVRWEPAEDQLTRLEPALLNMAHRGPDGQGTAQISIGTSSLTLGHTRLSIVDLTDGGKQPMFSEDGQFCLIYNGEIYNYIELRQELRELGCNFISESDSEVLLKAWMTWGPDSLTKFIGMFAFAILDQQARTLTLARDAFGIKPLYYSYSDSLFSFGSEIPALLDIGDDSPIIDWSTVYNFLVTGSYDVADRTFLAIYTDCVQLHSSQSIWLPKK